MSLASPVLPLLSAGYLGLGSESTMLPVSLTWSLVAFFVPCGSCLNLTFSSARACPPGLPGLSDQCSPFPSKLSRVTPTNTPAQLSADPGGSTEVPVLSLRSPDAPNICVVKLWVQVLLRPAWMFVADGHAGTCVHPCGQTPSMISQLLFPASSDDTMKSSSCCCFLGNLKPGPALETLSLF